MSYVTEQHIAILAEIAGEVSSSIINHGPESLPDGTSEEKFAKWAKQYRYSCQAAAARRECTWWHVLREEVFEAAESVDWTHLRAELLQVAAVVVKWIEDGDERPNSEREKI